MDGDSSTTRHVPLLDDGGDYTSSSSSSSYSTSSQPRFLTSWRSTPRFGLMLAVCLILVAVIFIGFIAVVIRRAEEPEPETKPAVVSPSDFAACMAAHATTLHPPTASPREGPDGLTPPLLLQNAYIHDGVGGNYTADILLSGGLIQHVGPSLPPVPGNTYDLRGAHVTPGLIDMHSHIGVYSWPGDLWANQDGNEMTNPIFPQVRAIDAFNPQDPAISWTRRGGVTTSLILPGSGNAMGGEATIIKHKSSNYVGDLLFPAAPRALKMACGENPKRVYGSQGETPMSRMGTAWVMRQAFEQAAALMQRQREWCSREPNARYDGYPNSLALDSLVALLQGQARLHQHCYKTYDFEMILRLAHEFNYSVSAFHHSLEAWKIPQRLQGITVATWADWWGFKTEAYDGSVYAPRILYDAGVPVAIKSDDVVVSNYLAFETAKAHHYGLPYEYAIQAVTYNPAVAMGIQHRTGSIRAGLEADIVVWDRDPLVLGARPSMVIIDGLIYHNETVQGPPAPFPAVAPSLSCDRDSRQQTLDCVVLTGLSVYSMVNSSEAVSGSTIVIRNGIVECVSSGSSSCAAPASCTAYRFSSPATAIPGLIESGSHIGQMEVDSEANWQDGAQSGSGADGSYSVIWAYDGIHTQSRHVSSARKAGVLTAVNAPLPGGQLVVGVSTAFHTATSTSNGSQPAFIDHSHVKQHVALHLGFGNAAKSPGLPASISGQTAALRALFTAANASLLNYSDPTDRLFAFRLAIAGRLPVSVDVHGADEILALLRLQRSFGFRLIIQGGAEAHLVAAQLAATTPPTAVVFTSRVPPSAFETLRTRDDSLRLLQAAGVWWGVQSASEDNARNLRWEGGWQRRYSGLSTGQILQGMTVSIARIFDLHSADSPWAAGVGQIAVGTRANLVVYDGDPLGVESRVQLVVLGRDLECRPIQY